MSIQGDVSMLMDAGCSGEHVRNHHHAIEDCRGPRLVYIRKLVLFYLFGM